MAVKRRKRNQKETAPKTVRKSRKGIPLKPLIGADLCNAVYCAVMQVFGVSSSASLLDSSLRAYAAARQATAVAFKRAGNFSDRNIAERTGLSHSRIAQTIKHAKTLKGVAKEKLDAVLAMVTDGSTPTDNQDEVTVREYTSEEIKEQRIKMAQSIVRETFLSVLDIFGKEENHDLVSESRGAFLYIMLIRFQYRPRDFCEDFGTTGYDVECLVGQATVAYYTHSAFREKIDRVLKALEATP